MSPALLTAEVSIVGCGPAGASAALTLAREGHSVVLLGRRSEPATCLGESVPPRFSAILKQLDVWDQFVQQGHARCFVTRSAWRNWEWDDQDYSMHPDGPWWHVDRSAFDAMLVDSARRAGATILECHRTVNLNRDPSGDWTIEFRTRDGFCTVKSRFLIDASGRRATIGRKLGVLRKTYDDLLGLLVFVPSKTTFDPSELYILIEASENGWWYSALLPSNQFVVGFMTDAPVLKTLGPNPALSWISEFRKTRLTKKRIDTTIEGLKPFCISAATAQTKSSGPPGFLAVGDALNTLDPLSAQGILNALESGVRGGRAVRSALAGDGYGVQEYFDGARRRFSTYLADRRRYYARVQRFANSAFWQKRIHSRLPGTYPHGEGTVGCRLPWSNSEGNWSSRQQ